jgi:hypothetical protein
MAETAGLIEQLYLTQNGSTDAAQVCHQSTV